MNIQQHLVIVTMTLAIAGTATPSLSAQRLEPSGLRGIGIRANELTRSVQDAMPSYNAARGIGGGLLAGGLGFGIGLLGGANLSSGPGCPGEDCGLTGAIAGAIAGESIGLALGNHYAGRGRANPVIATVASTAIGAAGVAAAFAAEGAAPFIIGVTPIVQLAVLMAMER